MRSNSDTDSLNILKGIDPCLPPGIRGNSAISLEGLIRSRVLACILVCSIALTAFSFLAFGLLYLLTEHDFFKPVVFCFASLVLVSLNYLYFYKSAKLDAAGIFYSLSFFSVCVISIVLTGGYASPVKQMLICCPVISFLISGRHEGFYNAALVFVVGVVLLILDQINFPLLQIMSADVLPYISGIVWLGAIVLIVLCLYIYDLLLDQKRSIRAKT
jgi:hypothetical protein